MNNSAKPGTEMSDADLYERYFADTSSVLPPSDDILDSVAMMSEYIKQQESRFPDDAIHADILAQRLVKFTNARINAVLLMFILRPWTWLQIRRQTGIWPWEEWKR